MLSFPKNKSQAEKVFKKAIKTEDNKLIIKATIGMFLFDIETLQKLTEMYAERLGLHNDKKTRLNFMSYKTRQNEGLIIPPLLRGKE